MRSTPQFKAFARTSVSGGLALAVAGLTSLCVAGPAFAADPVAQGTGVFLSGSAAGVAIAGTVGVPATATNQGTPPSVTDLAPLTTSALNAVDVGLGGGVKLVGAGGILALGAVNQVALASSDGSS